MNKFKVFFSFVAAGLIAVDQIIKMWALESLRTIGSIEIIPGLFNLSYVENRGAAFGILQGHTTLLAVITGVVLLAAIVWAFWRVNDKILTVLVFVSIAGGVGNLIDRVFRGFVVDYLDFSAIWGFPVFNFADCCAVMGLFSLMIYLFISEHKEEIAKTAQ